VQVICGAPNARTGMKGVFAPPGSYVPGIDLTLKKAKIRGVESCGMLCSEREMQISDEHEGIIELPEDAPVGAPFARVAGLDDPVIDIAITPNRPDALGVAGIARDLAAAGPGKAKTPDRGEYRRYQCLPDVHRSARTRRQEWPVAGLAAASPARHRAAADFNAGGYHQLSDP